MQKYRVLIFFLVLSMGCYCENNRIDLNVKNIPDSLKINANAVIRFSTTVFDYKSSTSGIEKDTKAITVFELKGKDLADFHYSGDKFRELRSFSGKLYDANGVLLRKFKISDVLSTEWSSSLASDARHYYFDCETPAFPFTIVYEYEINWKNGILVFPAFYPQYAHNLSVERATHTLILPSVVEFRSKAFNIASKPVKTTLKETSTYEWNVSNLRAIENESYDPYLDIFVPLLYLCPTDFVYDGVPGAISDWESMGKWENNLLKGRNLLPEETRKKIIELTKDAKSEREKVHILYDYLGETTRYVNISLGIGGYQPMPSSEVAKTGFGDCKALSNYMMAMLEVVGIHSNFTEIRLDETDKTLYKDYANFNQMNHIILQVPLPKDTLWLECTNPRVPFGFVHNGISGHDALVDTEQGGKIECLPDYPDSLNIEKNNVSIVLNEDGSAHAIMKKTCNVKIYDNYNWFPLAKFSRQADDLREDIDLPSVTIDKIQVTDIKSSLPSLGINYTWSTPLYGTKTGNRLFVPINPFRSVNANLKRNSRLHDIKILAGYKDIDSIFISIPEGFDIETMPSSNNMKTSYGYFESKIQLVDKGILIQQILFIPSGEYKRSTYPDFLSFFERISSSYKSKIIFKRRVSLF